MKVQNKEEILKLLTENNLELKKFGVIRIGLFGSFISDEQRDDSDVDLLVEFEPEKKSFKNFMETANLTEKLFGRKVEIVTPQSLSPYIEPYVRREVKYVQTA